MTRDASIDEFVGRADDAASDAEDDAASDGDREAESVESDGDREAESVESDGDREAESVEGAVAERDDDADPVDGAADGGGSAERTVDARVSVAAPAATTSRFEPAGAACADCGAEVVRLWFADGNGVCADCKPW